MEIVFGALVGVLAFLVGQYVLRMVLEPLARLRRTTAQISLSLLSNQRKLQNLHPDPELEAELRRLAAELVSGVDEIPYSNIILNFSLVGKFNPSEALEAARNLNLVAATLEQGVPAFAVIIESTAEIRHLLKIPTSYSGKSE